MSCQRFRPARRCAIRSGAACVLCQDRALFTRLRGPKHVETFTAGPDLDDRHSPEAFESLQATLLEAAHRHRGAGLT